MNSKKFFEECKKAGIEAAQLVTTRVKDQSFEIFEGEIDNSSLSDVTKIQACGIYNNKMGFVACENNENSSIKTIIDLIKESSLLLDKEDIPEIFKGSEKYHKKNLFNKELEEVSFNEKLEFAKNLEKYAKEFDSRVTDTEVSFSYTLNEVKFENSYGLKLHNKANYVAAMVNVIVKDENETQSDYGLIIESDFSKLDAKKIAEEAVTKAIKKLHGTTIETNKYKVIFSQKAIGSLLGALLSHIDGEDVQKHVSQFEGKLNTQVVSKKLTIKEMPLLKNVYFNYFDDEGVATYNKDLIVKGVLKTYIYNLESAKKAGTTTTGNASRSGGKMMTSLTNVVVKPGKLSFDELVSKIGNGVYITSVSGLHAGLNSESGDFSLQSNGFVIENGKVGEPLNLIVASGNLFKLFNDVIAVGNDSELLYGGTTTPSIAVKNIKISK